MIHCAYQKIQYGGDIMNSNTNEASKELSISDVAKLYDVSTRTIRYYEEVGLLHPSRTASGQRTFSRKETTRLKLIFKGKKYGFQLYEIKEMIELFDRDPTGKKQLARTVEYGQEKINEVTERIDELMMIRSEMETLLREYNVKLHELESDHE